MEEIVLKANFDFESVIFKSKTVESYNRELESILFPLYKETFLSSRNYSEEFLKHVKNLNPKFKITNKLKNKKIKYCWGDIRDKELQKILNSKKTSNKISQKLKFSKIDTLNDMTSFNKFYREKKKIFLRPYDSFSGIGNLTLEYPQIVEYQLGSYLIQEFVSVSKAYGVRINSKGIAYITQNLVNEKGNFLGAIYNKSNNKLLEEYYEHFNYIYKEYAKLGASSIQLDCFEYQKNGKLALEILAEVNHRKTMGDTLVELSNILSQKDHALSLLMMIPRKSINTSNSVLLNKSTDCFNLISLSDRSNKKFFCYYLSGSCEGDLNLGLEQLFEMLQISEVVKTTWQRYILSP